MVDPPTSPVPLMTAVTLLKVLTITWSLFLAKVIPVIWGVLNTRGPEIADCQMLLIWVDTRTYQLHVLDPVVNGVFNPKILPVDWMVLAFVELSTPRLMILGIWLGANCKLVVVVKYTCPIEAPGSVPSDFLGKVKPLEENETNWNVLLVEVITPPSRIPNPATRFPMDTAFVMVVVSTFMGFKVINVELTD